jgi:hypothetical protein
MMIRFSYQTLVHDTSILAHTIIGLCDKVMSSTKVMMCMVTLIKVKLKFILKPPFLHKCQCSIQ